MDIHTSFVMAVLNRSRLLKNTLEGYRRYSPYPDVELVIADYGSTDDLLGVLNNAKDVFGRIRCLILDRSKSVIPINPKFNNPAVALNVAISAAKANLIIMSPPECYPLADNIRKARALMKNGVRKAALLGKAMGMPKEASGFMENDGWMPANESQVYQRVEKRKMPVWSSKQEDVLRPIPFFIAFRKEDHKTINGFDEEYVRGYGGEDRDYVLRLKLAGVELVWDDCCGVLHQWHPRIPSGAHGTDPRRPNWKRDGVKVNLAHEPGSLKMVSKEVSFWPQTREWLPMTQESVTKDRVVRAIFRHMMGPERFAWRSDMAAHLPTLYLLARHWGQKNIVELGVNEAFSTIGLLAGALEADCSMVSYDIVHCGANLWKNIGLAPDPTLKWEFRQMDSLKAAHQWKDGSIGLWFLDTSHKLEPTRQELSAWLPKLAKDGVMCGHDYYMHEQRDWVHKSGVKTAVDEFANLHRNRFQLQVLPHDHGLWILWPHPPIGPELQTQRRAGRRPPARIAVPCDECGVIDKP